MAVSVGSARSSANAADLCGDAAQAWFLEDRTVIAIADGLGHGADAAVAATAALDFIGGHLDDDPVELFRGMHQALVSTRGAAVAVATIRPADGELTYAAIGNTRAAVFGWRATRLDSFPGIVGGGFRRLTPLVVPIRAGDHLVLWTDGLAERLAVTDIDPVPAHMAETLLHRFAQGNDDACVIVARLDAQ